MTARQIFVVLVRARCDRLVSPLCLLTLDDGSLARQARTRSL